MTADTIGQINESDFTNGYASSGGSIYFAGDCSIKINSCRFENNAASTYGGAFYSNNNNITINNSTFLDNKCKLQASDIYVTFGDIEIDSSHFYISDDKVSVYTTSTITRLAKVRMIGVGDWDYGEIGSNYAAGLYVEDTTSLVVNSSSFENLTFAQYGGAIVILKSGSVSEGDRIPEETYYTIIDSNFTSNTAYAGGAIYVYNTETVLISNCIFNSNAAISGGEVRDWNGLGGAIHYETSGRFYM